MVELFLSRITDENPHFMGALVGNSHHPFIRKHLIIDWFHNPK